jgi:hypothetical protein
VARQFVEKLNRPGGRQWPRTSYKRR